MSSILGGFDSSDLKAFIRSPLGARGKKAVGGCCPGVTLPGSLFFHFLVTADCGMGGLLDLSNHTIVYDGISAWEGSFFLGLDELGNPVFMNVLFFCLHRLPSAGGDVFATELTFSGQIAPCTFTNPGVLCHGDGGLTRNFSAGFSNDTEDTVCTDFGFACPSFSSPYNIQFEVYY